MEPQAESLEWRQQIDLEQAARPREEMNALYLCFGTGLLIGGFFLIYVVIAFTGLAS